MAKDYTTVDVRHSQLKGLDFVQYANKKCHKAFSKILVWQPELVPHRLLITPDQFNELAKLNKDKPSKPTGKERFLTSEGFLFEIIVEEG